jgi:hypothetical protein
MPGRVSKWPQRIRDGALLIAAFGSLAGIFGTCNAARDIADRQAYQNQLLQKAAADETEAHIQVWQETEVFRLIFAAGDNGITVDDLLKSYSLDGLTVVGLDIPKNKLTDFELRRLLVSLINKRAIVALGTNKFKIPADCDFCGGSRSAQEVFDKNAGPTLKYLAQENGTKSVEQVVTWMRDVLTLKNGEEYILFGALSGAHYIGVDKKSGNVWQMLVKPDKADDVYFGPIAGVIMTPQPEQKSPAKK